MDSTVASEVEAVLDDLANHRAPSPKLEALLARAKRGEDLSDAVETLTKVLVEGTDVRLLSMAGEALLWHWIHVGDTTQLLPILRRVRWPRYLTTALETVSEAGADIGPFLSVLIRESATSIEGLDLKRVLAIYSRDDPARKTRMGAEAAAKDPQLFVDFLVEVILWRRETSGLEGLIPPLRSLLETSRGRLRTDALRVAALLAESELELSGLLPALTPLLASSTTMVAEAAAYAVALDAIGRGDWPALDGLRSRSSKWLRKGACRGLVVRYRGREEVDSEHLRRVVLGLREPEAEVRGKILEALEEAAREGRPARAPEDVLDELRAVPQDDPTFPVLREYLYCVGAGDEVAEGCELCRALPRQKSWTSERLLPVELGRLVDEGKWRFCPDCQTAYAYDYWEEYDVNSCDRRWTLRRLSPTEAAAVLPKPRLAEARARQEGALALATRELDHPQLSVRREAAWVLTEAYLDQRDWDGLGVLLRSSDPEIRTEVYATTARPSRYPKVAEIPDYGLPAELISQGLAEKDPRARRAAARVLARRFVRAKNWQGFRLLVGDADAVILESAMLTASAEAAGGASLSPVVEELARLFDHADELVRRAAGRALESTRQTEKVKAVRAEVFERLLRDGDVGRYRDTAWSFVKAAKQGVRLSDEVLPVLGRHLHDPARVWSANCALLGMIRSGSSIEAVLPNLFQALADPELVEKGSFHETLWALRDKGVDLSKYASELVATMGSDDPNMSQTAYDLVVKLHEAGADLTPQRGQLLAQMTNLAGFQNEKLAGVLGAIEIRRGAWDQLVTLLQHDNKDVRWGTCRAIKREGPIAAGAELVLPALLAVLGDRSEYLRVLAGEAARAVLEREPKLRPMALGLLAGAPSGEPRDALQTWLKGLTFQA